MNYSEIGIDVIKYFNLILLSYSMTLLIVSINTFKIVCDYVKIKKGIKTIIRNMFNVVVTIICGLSQAFGLIFTGILTDTYNARWFNILFIISVISIILFFIQLYFYIKMRKNIEG